MNYQLINRQDFYIKPINKNVNINRLLFTESDKWSLDRNLYFSELLAWNN